MSADLIAFLTARLDEDEAIADLISSGGYHAQHWRLNDDEFGTPHLAVEIDGDRLVEVRAIDGVIDGELDEDGGVVAYVRDGRNEHLHIARHDPARVLREVAFKRRLLMLHTNAAGAVAGAWEGTPGRNRIVDQAYLEAITDVLAEVATAWSDHPDYRQEWTP